MTLPTIISLAPDQWSVPGVTGPGPRPAWGKKIKEKIRAGRAWAGLAGPLARLTVAALVFETGKIIAGLLAPELQPWGVTL